jgi:hypothetical protein
VTTLKWDWAKIEADGTTTIDKSIRRKGYQSHRKRNGNWNSELKHNAVDAVVHLGRGKKRMVSGKKRLNTPCVYTIRPCHKHGKRDPAQNAFV